MKKIYFLGLLFGFGMSAQIVNIPDANFKAKLLAADVDNTIASTTMGLGTDNYVKIDVNNDGEIQQSEALLIGKLRIGNAEISDLTGISSFSNLYSLFCENNELTQINFEGLAGLHIFIANNNNFQQLDFSPTIIAYFNLSYNPNLTHLNLKNGRKFFLGEPPFPGGMGYEMNFYATPSLQYICVDENEANYIQSRVNSYGYTNCIINSYCSFVPGGEFFTIQGNNKLDQNNNGCNDLDFNVPNLKFNITDGTTSGVIIPNETGNYAIPLQAGNYTITPILENPNYFSISPTVLIINFPQQPSPFTQDFCITPNGTNPDLEIMILPIDNARPGFDAHYKIVYKNKGTNTQSGIISFDFNDTRVDFITASPVGGANFGHLQWNFTGLQPFASGEIFFTLNVNSSSEPSPVNSGDYLGFVAHITGMIDTTPNDNAALLRQLVVNSLNPYDKTCIEGNKINPELAGQYVHYMIRFENTGTANAQNIVVKDIIDTAKFDVASLIPLDGSHPFTTRITETNKGEFIFENIQLPFDDANNDGFVAFKIKTLPTLPTGDSFSNTASIYFDYNAPIVTDPAITTLQVLGREDFKFENYFTIFPNPASDVLNIESIQAIEISSISIYNTLGQLVLVVPNATDTIDVSALTSGNYFMKILSDKGSTSARFVKE